MKTVIKTGKGFSKEVKYIVIDQDNKSCKIVPEELASKQKGQEIISFVKEKLKGYRIELVNPLPLELEIKFLWPQLLYEFKKRFPYVNGWLERANLSINEQTLIIEVENRIAHKKLSEPDMLNYLQNRLYYYLEEELKVRIDNGDFLGDIPEVTPEITAKKLLKKEKPVKRQPEENNHVILGREITAKATHTLNQIESEEDGVIVEGQVFEMESFKTKKGGKLFLLDITDNTNSITVKFFINNQDNLKGSLKEGDWIRARGYVQYDQYSKGLTLMARDINTFKPPEKQDEAVEKRIELHLHTRMSAMDSVVDVEKAIKRAADWGHPAIAITDHGVVQAFPDAYQAGKKYGIKVIYGLEAYMVDDGKPIISDPGEGRLDETTFTVFDLETTGLKSNQDEIIEIGAIKVKEGEIIDEYSTFVNPGREIPPGITKITGITDEMVAEAPKIEDVIDDLIEFIGDSVLVAHNAGFDYSFLRAALQKTGKKEERCSLLDTLGLCRALYPELKNHKLNTISEYLGVELTNHHRAVDDARATAYILIKSLAFLKEREIVSLDEINRLTKKIDWKNLPLYHLIILAKNKAGLKDLYRLVSSSHLDHFYRKPRILKSELIFNRENLILGSACEAGQLYRSIVDNKSSREIEEIARFYDFLEIQPIANNRFMIGKKVNSEEELQEINKQIYNLGKKLNKPVIATGDVHFLDPEDAIYREILQAGQGYDQSEEQAPLYLRTTGEMLAEFSYLGPEIAREVVIDNPRKIMEMIDDLKPLPDGLFTPKINGAEEQIRRMTYQRAHQLYGDELPELVENRLERELKSIIDNGFSVIYLIAHKLVKKSLHDGYLVGSRGSVGSSLVATMCEITEVNPLPPHYRCPECKHSEFVEEPRVGVGIDLPDKKCPECGASYIKDGYDIPFEVFMGFEGDKVPDIDLNFSGEYQGEIHRYTEELFGRDYVFRAGTISTIAKRTAFGFVKGYLDDNDLKVNNAELKRLVRGCTGVRRTTGQHPGGLMVVPRHLDIHDFTPIQHPANDQETTVRTTHFDYHSISGRILKLDLLGHDDPTSIRMLQDLTGVSPEEIPLDDPETMAIFSSTDPLGVTPEEIGTTVGTLGIPEFGTSFVRQMLVETKPTTFAELIRISGLSHGTDVWLNNAQELIRSGQAKLAEVISVRDDIMNYLIQKGLEPGKAFWIMEHVRKGKGLTVEEEAYMRENNVPEWYIDSCKKIKYMFPKAHAAAYVMMAFRIAYFKVHYPEAFYATYFTTKAGDFDAQLISQGYEHILKVKQKLEERGNDLTAKEKGVLTILEIVIEAMARGIKFTTVDLYRSDAYRFKITDDGLLPPLVSLEGLGNSAAASIAATREEGEFTSIEDLVNRTRISKTVVEIMQKHGTLEGLPEKNQLSLFLRS